MPFAADFLSALSLLYFGKVTGAVMIVLALLCFLWYRHGNSEAMSVIWQSISSVCGAVSAGGSDICSEGGIGMVLVIGGLAPENASM